jgi:hypothetical protein
VFDKEFFATSLPVAIGHYTAAAPPPSPQVRLLTADGTEYVVRRVVFRPAADRPEQLGFRDHVPGELDDAAPPSASPPAAPAILPTTSGQPPEVATTPRPLPGTSRS